MHSTKLALVLATAGALLAAAPAGAATFTVKNDNNAGVESLRRAINDANTTPGADLITFDINPALAPFVITPPAGDPLPALTESVVIDGTTQPGYAGAPLIEIDAVNVPNGLVIPSDGNAVRGLAIHSAALAIGSAPPDGNGILITGDDNHVLSSHLGTDAAGTAPFGNDNAGVRISGERNFVGLPNEGNVIADNLNDGVEIVAGTGNVVQANTIGLDATGAVLGNLNHGIDVATGGTRIGGSGAPAANVISGNLMAGVRITAGTASAVLGNLIGTDSGGTAARPNAVGVQLRSAANSVGGTNPGEGNLISGNTGAGIHVLGNENTIQANKLGTDVAGSAALPNRTGIEVSGDANTISGDNLISGNTEDGVHIEPRPNQTVAPDGNRVEGNLIGTDAAGTAALANGRDGVHLRDVRRTYVGSAGAGNVISGNTRNGVFITNSDPMTTLTTAASNRVRANRIGTDATGANALGNGASGVLIVDSHGNEVGDDNASQNTIANNASDGVTVFSGSDNVIARNAIYANGDLGIDLADNGVTLNDTLDPDTGANLLQNFPRLGLVTVSGATTTVNWTFNGAPSRNFRVELYSSPACDPSGHGEGRTFLKSFDITTDANGNAAGSTTLKLLARTPVFTATATALRSLGILPLTPTSTSEFSRCAS